MATKRRQKSASGTKKASPGASEQREPSYTSATRRVPFENIFINGKERAFLLKSEVIELLGDWPKVVDRMLHASRNGKPWLKIVSNQSGNSGSEVRVTAESVAKAIERLSQGEEPPLLPSERRQSATNKSHDVHLTTIQEERQCTTRETKHPGRIPDKSAANLLRAADLLPAGVTAVTFHQKLKLISVHWTNGDHEYIRRVSKRGRNTRVISVRFDTSPNNIPILPANLESD